MILTGFKFPRIELSLSGFLVAYKMSCKSEEHEKNSYPELFWNGCGMISSSITGTNSDDSKTYYYIIKILQLNYIMILFMSEVNFDLQKVFK